MKSTIALRPFGAGLPFEVMEMKPEFEIEQSACFSSFYFLRRNIPHVGPKFEFSGLMDDFGFLVPIDFKALAIHLQEEGSSK